MKVLGLDLGTNSLGWAILEEKKLIAAGVRVFEAGMEGNLLDGTQESRNATRREKRMLRRQHDRRARRMQKIMRILQDAQLMPKTDNMAEAIETIDQQALQRLKLTVSNQNLSHVVPYRLRAEALDKRLDDFELGRSLYHLAQRRGFLSNRKTVVSTDTDEEETGKVKTGIHELYEKMQQTSARTLGEYFSWLNPSEERIRGRYTGRDMYVSEFKLVLARQREFGNTKVTSDFENNLYKAIFKQRPLKSCRHLIGWCPFEKHQRRAPWYHPLAQKFRVLQTVNHLRLQFESGDVRPLTADERKKLLLVLYRSSSVKIASAKKLLNLNSKKNPCQFSIEEGGEKSLPGHSVNARLVEVFGEDRWMTQLSESDQLTIILDIHSYTSSSGLKLRGMKKWGLSEEAAEDFSEIQLPPDYAGLSLVAIKKLLPFMEQGQEYMSAVNAVYGNVLRMDKVYDELPMIKGFIKDLRNPAVERTLTQLRHVVNPIIRKFGKPDAIHIELAREMKKSAKEKKLIIKKMRAKEQLRQDALAALKTQFPEFSQVEPNRRDIEKYLLWRECRGQCPYSGRPISPTSLFSSTPEYDIEHIIPYSICLDDSFANKTLCHVRINREEKRNRSPYLAFGADDVRYPAMLERVSKFESPYKNEKLRRFKVENLDEFADFANRQLNDTSYASKLAKGYIAALYGGTYDETRQRVVAVSGNITAIVRNYYRMNSILGEGGKKIRTDHRHHAIDAIVLAITSQRTVQCISETAAEFASKSQRLMYQGESEPWCGFLNEVRRVIEEIKVTHATSRKIRGALHEETNYGIVKGEDGIVSYRTPLEKISSKDVANIRDIAVRQIVVDKFISLGILDPEAGKINDKKLSLLSNPDNLPRMKTKDGSIGPVIKSVRCCKPLAVVKLGSAEHPRAVLTGSNHHMEILEAKDHKGALKWEGICVSMLEAHKRKRQGLPVIQRDHGPDKTFIFSLAFGDIIECKMDDDEKARLYVVRSVPQSKQLGFVSICNAMKKSDLGKEFKTKCVEPLRLTGARKVTLTPFGEIRYAND